MSDVRQFFEEVASRWSRGEISSGKAAEILRITRIEFLEWAAKNRMNPPPYSAEDLARDLRFGEGE